MSERLRELLEGATPGPWRYDGRDIFTKARNPSGPHHIVLALPETFHHSQEVPAADARLIALAPELAALVADMGDMLGDQVRGFERCDCETCAARKELLARLDALVPADPHPPGREEGAA